MRDAINKYKARTGNKEIILYNGRTLRKLSKLKIRKNLYEKR